MESPNPKFALYAGTSECARTNTLLLLLSEVFTGAVSLWNNVLLFFIIVYWKPMFYSIAYTKYQTIPIWNKSTSLYKYYHCLATTTKCMIKVSNLLESILLYQQVFIQAWAGTSLCNLVRSCRMGRKQDKPKSFPAVWDRNGKTQM